MDDLGEARRIFREAWHLIFPPGAWNWSWLFFAGLGSANGQHDLHLSGLLPHLQSGRGDSRAGKKYPARDFAFDRGIAILVPRDADKNSGSGAVARGREIAIYREHFVERLYGTRAATFATIMILWIAFASLFTTLLGYSRVPYAAAEDGNFFPVFARVHPTEKFPACVSAFPRARPLVFSVMFPAFQRDQSDSRHAPDHAVHRPGRRSNDLASPLASQPPSL